MCLAQTENMREKEWRVFRVEEKDLLSRLELENSSVSQCFQPEADLGGPFVRLFHSASVSKGY